MKVFVFLTRYEGKYNIGLLKEDGNLSDMQKVFQISATELRGILNSIEADCIFVGKNLRTQVLTPMLHELVCSGADLPGQLKFHWVPPYKLQLDDVAWLYDFGMFTEETEKMSIYELAKSLGIGIQMTSEVEALARIYFSLVGDFNRLH